MKNIFIAISCFILCFIIIEKSYAASFADLTATERADALRNARMTEANGIADSLCRAIALATGEVGIALFGFILITVGVGVLQGKVNPGLFIGLTIGIAVFFSAESFVGLFALDKRAKGGCKCRASIPVGKFIDTNGDTVTLEQDLKLKDDCTSSDPVNAPL